MALAQGFNVDFEVSGGGPLVGQGTPQSSFGAAANQAGHWSSYGVAASLPIFLHGLDGTLTNVAMSKDGIGGGIGGGSGWQINTGDYRALLNDYARIPDESIYRFTGLLPGRYFVYTYAIDAGGATRVAEVSINDSVSSNPQLSGQGAMPGNSFSIGLTHCVHEVNLTSSTMLITLRNHVPGPPNASVNGFQIVMVPEPFTVVAMFVGSVPILLRRFKKI